MITKKSHSVGGIFDSEAKRTRGFHLVEETCYSQECLVKVGSQESLVDCLIILGVDLGDCVVDSVEILEVDSAVILVEILVVFLEADSVVILVED